MSSTISLLSIEQRIDRVQTRIENACESVGRRPEEITLIAVSKYVDRAAVDDAYAAGVRHFGENRVHDLASKYATPLPEDASLHFVGYLQSNKAARAANECRLVHSVDRPSVINALSKHGDRFERQISVLLQVNVAGETQKAGCSAADAETLAESIATKSSLRLDGLMTMAPLSVDPESTRPVFHQLRELRDVLVSNHPEWSLPVLSMGMTDDFEVAIQEGATHVRIGRAIFGE